MKTLFWMLKVEKVVMEPIFNSIVLKMSMPNNFIFIKSPGDSISGTPVNYLSIKNIFDKLLIKVSHGMFC